MLLHALPQLVLIHWLAALEHRYRFLPRHRYDAARVDAGACGVAAKEISGIVKGGVGCAGLAARPLKCARHASGVVPRINVFRLRLTPLQRRWIHEHPWTAHVSCSSFARGCQCLTAREGAAFIGLVCLDR